MQPIRLKSICLSLLIILGLLLSSCNLPQALPFELPKIPDLSQYELPKLPDISQWLPQDSGEAPATGNTETPQEPVSPEPETGEPPTEAETPVEEAPIEEFPVETELPEEITPEPEPTPSVFYAHFPLMFGRPLSPGPDWRLNPSKTVSDNPDLNYSLLIQAPHMDVNSGDRGEHFNTTIQAYIQSLLASIPISINNTPVPPPGGLVWVNYQIPSSAGWTPAGQASFYHLEPVAYDFTNGSIRARHEIISVLFEIFVFLGGKDPGTSHAAINFDLKTGKQIYLADLFKPDVDYLNPIYNMSVEELRHRKKAVFDGFEQNIQPAPENYLVWNITPGGLLITFEEYKVAIVGKGPQQVLIPWEALLDMIDPEGPIGPREQ